MKRLTQRNPNPYDGEPFYNLGLSLKFQGKTDAAYDNFYKACWNAAWQDSGYFSLAQISALHGNWSDALYEIDKSLDRNASNMVALHLKTIVLRKSGQKDAALELIDEILRKDRFNFGALYEKYLLTCNDDIRKALTSIMRNDSHNYEELALDYLAAGQYDDCVGILRLSTDACTKISPMVYYYMGYASRLAGNTDEAAKAFTKAAEQDPAYCFPNRLEAILALEAAAAANPEDAKAQYYLGNLWYDKRQHGAAITCWEKSVKIDEHFPTAKRNLALGYFNKLGRKEEAVTLLEEAFALDPNDSRILMELDQLYKRMQRPHSFRKEFLDRFREQINQRDDLYLEYVTLLNQLGQWEEAKKMIDVRKFHPWEGGEGKVPAQYQTARVELAKKALQGKEWDTAIALLEECYIYPNNLGEGKLQGAQENDFNYWMGCALEGKGRKAEAEGYFRAASRGLSEPCDAMYYYDQKPDKIFYQGLAWLKLGDKTEAKKRFRRLIEYGEQHLNDEVKIDYFAVSLPDLLIWEDDLDRRNRIHCHYMMGLGFLGLGDRINAEKHLGEASRLDINHQGVQCHKAMI